MKYSNKGEFKKANIFGMGIPNFMLSRYMTGKSYLNPLKMAGRSLMLANVTFSPGSRTFWHIHRGTQGGGQILICTAGEGWYQEQGQEPIALVPGVVINIPTDLLHWHGAKKDSWFSHIAVEIGGENVKNEFVRQVTEDEYSCLPENEPAVKTEEATAFDRENVFGKGIPNDMFAQYFTGNSYLNPMFKPEKGRPFVANVTFEPGCRNHWHIHKAFSGGGQVLICTAGEGWYQQEGKKPKRLKPGDTVYISAGIKHWHGATKNSWFSHLSIEVPGEKSSNEWLEPVADEAYDKL
jgi:quercetin dioxygenase-like cupin family protein